MLLFTTTGWFYFQDAKGKLTVLVEGEPAVATNCLFPVPATFSNINAAQAALPNYRKALLALICQLLNSKQNLWIPPVERKRWFRPETWMFVRDTYLANDPNYIWGAMVGDLFWRANRNNPLVSEYVSKEEMLAWALKLNV